MTCQMTLAARLRMATNSFFGYMSFLSRTRGPLAKRLQLLGSFVTNKWRWLSAAVRPLHAVAQQLRSLQTTFLLSMCRLPTDPLATCSENWKSRRRAAKMAAQSCNHRPWDAVHLESFMNYWGHAARMDPELLRPIQRVLQVRDQEWMERHPEIRRRMGRWPNAPFGLTLLWRRCRLAGDPVWWEDMAHSRDRWKQFTDEVFHIKGSLKTDFMRTFIMWTCVEGACCEQEIDSGCCPRRTLPSIRPTPRPSNMFPTLRKPLRPHVSALRAMVAVKACTLDLEWLFCRLMAASLRTLLFQSARRGQPCHQYSCRAVGSH